MPAIADGEAGPATLVINRDFLSQALAQLPADERRMAELRLEGRSWPEIGGMMGGNAQALRVRFSRAIDRLTVELGLEESP
jgi:DNA-directed RNA polymerase specialized sigma24 family protein